MAAHVRHGSQGVVEHVVVKSCYIARAVPARPPLRVRALPWRVDHEHRVHCVDGFDRRLLGQIIGEVRLLLAVPSGLLSQVPAQQRAVVVVALDLGDVTTLVLDDNLQAVPAKARVHEIVHGIQVVGQH